MLHGQEFGEVIGVENAEVERLDRRTGEGEPLPMPRLEPREGDRE